MKQEFDMFEIEYTESDLEYIDDLIKYFKKNYKTIMNFFHLKEFSKKVKIKFWDSKEEYRDYFNKLYKEKGYNNTVPEWKVARSFPEECPKIFLISYKESLNCKGHEKDIR